MSKILLIEDQRWLGRMFVQILSSAGYKTKYVLSAEEAEQAADFAADLLLIDNGLPGKKGIKALPDLKKIFPQAKLVVLSNFSKKEYGAKARAQGADEFWNKTETIGQLPEYVKQILGN